VFQSGFTFAGEYYFNPVKELQEGGPENSGLVPGGAAEVVGHVENVPQILAR
jgi:hypothetical protein